MTSNGMHICNKRERYDELMRNVMTCTAKIRVIPNPSRSPTSKLTKKAMNDASVSMIAGATICKEKGEG